MSLKMNEPSSVKEQYQKSDNLKTRISIHDKYSTNKMGIGNWYFTIYKIENGMKLLELGCGTGSMWIKHKDAISKCFHIVFSDLSEGMLAEAKKNIGEAANAEYKVIDIQEIPFEDDYFDIVIANCMLYHVPNIDKALAEVSRVLKKGGHFYASTTGGNGIMETITRILEIDLVYVNTFSLENGTEKLKPYFSKIEIERYKDSLEVTNIDDLMEYIYSGITFKNACKMPTDEVRNKLLSCMEDGVLRLPKDPGMFVAVK
ncbi:MAG: class I SAM-dependent methyltransferase [Lachnospiraceae bacterium]|nr:class I SAM-dependent methyltransferase [Lachnospiraceae bacterium]